MSGRFRVFYNSFAPPEFYAVMREHCPPELELVLLESDDDAERRRKVAGARAVLVAATRLTRETIAAGTALEFVQHQGVGYQDTIDVPALRERRLRLALTTAGTTSVAEHTLMLALAACRRLPYADAELRQGRWHTNDLRPVVVGLAGKTVGYVGMGRIGRAVAQRFRAFDTAGVYFDPVAALDPAEEAALGLRRAGLDEVLEAADILTLHLPLTEATRGLIGARELARLKPRCVLVNAARGGIVDEAALVEGLKAGRPLAAGLDVFASEPVAAGAPLTRLPNVVLTPHLGAGSWDALVEKIRFMLDNTRRYALGQPVENEVPLP
jgi:phosphoglycerate dehydrogenase-like enzyme